MHHEAPEPLLGEVGASLGGWEVRVAGEKFVKDGSKTRLQIRRSANDRLNCINILHEITILGKRMRKMG